MASLSQDGCDYSTVTGPAVEQITGSKNIPFVEIGFVAYREPNYNDEKDSWSVVYSGPCTRYDPELEDTWWSAAKAFAFGALVLGGASALFLWFTSCFVFSPGTWRWAGYQVLLAFICQCLAFLWYGTGMCREDGNSCSLFYGSRADICAAVFWFVSAIMIFCRYPKPEPKPEQPIMNATEPSVGVTEIDLPIQGDATASLPAPTGTISDQAPEGQRLTESEII